MIKKRVKDEKNGVAGYEGVTDMIETEKNDYDDGKNVTQPWMKRLKKTNT